MTAKQIDSHPDDWRDDTLLRLESSLLYTTLREQSAHDPAAAAAVQLVQEAAHYACQRTKLIVRHLGEFTLHDSDHLFRVIHLMARLLPDGTRNQLSAPELMLLLLSAFFHDIGMAPDEKTVLAWKKVWDQEPQFDEPAEEAEYARFQRYYNARPEEQSQLQQFTEDGASSSVDLMKSYLVADYIRITHAERARQILQADWQGRIRYRDADLTVELAGLCESHGKEASELLDLDNNLLCGPNLFVSLPLVGVLLRVADILDFDAKRTPPVLFSHLFVRHPVSLQEWNKHRAIQAWNISCDQIQFHAKCRHPAIEAAIHDFCDIIDRELSVCCNISGALNSGLLASRNLRITFPFRVDRSKIETQKNILGRPEYIYRKTHFSLSKSQVIDLLMGTKLYGDPEVALRELVQNSIDACLLRAALESSWGNSYFPEIHVRYSGRNGEPTLEVSDNGTGMDQHIIDEYYSKVGSSFYKSSEFYDLKSQSRARFTPTSRFGIGILSCFMVADTMVVETRRVYGPHESSEPINLTIEGQESIFWIKQGNRKVPGTSTRLVLRKKKNPWEHMSEEAFIQSVERVVANPPFKITIEGDSTTKVRDQHSFEQIKARSLKDYTWNTNPNVREISLAFNDRAQGFTGTAIVAILESKGAPVSDIEMRAKTIKIDGEDYRLDKRLALTEDEIELHTSSITIDEDGDVDKSESSTNLAKSKSRVSLHGIEIPTTFFPDRWAMQRNQVRLVWPFPILLVIDVCSPLDLDLNSSRTQIIESPKWHRFEEVLSCAVCDALAQSVTASYWRRLCEVIQGRTRNRVFVKAMERAAASRSGGRVRQKRRPVDN